MPETGFLSDICDTITYMIFPSLRGKRVKEIDINKMAETWLTAHADLHATRNPLLDPATCQSMLDEFYADEGIDYSYGGYMEDRSIVWHDSYLAKTGSYVHLGVDFNAPSGTPVAVDIRAQVLFTDDDSPLDGGWGAHVMMKALDHDIYLLYAHLGRDITCNAGDVLQPGGTFARVGTPETNGHWYPHVHGQALAPETYELYKNDLRDSMDMAKPATWKNSRNSFRIPLSG